MKAQVTIEIPEGYELAEPEMRQVDYGEWYLDGELVAKWNFGSTSNFVYPILRKGAWKPKEGEVCWCVNTEGEVIYFGFDDDERWDRNLLARGNYFRTRQSAKRAAEKVRELLLSITD